MDTEALQILQELQTRAEHVFHTYEPQQGQGDFHKSNKYIRLLFGGNQSGKSRAAAQEIAWWYTHSHPYKTLPDKPLVIWVISTEYATIRAGVYRHLLNTVPDWEIEHRGSKVQGHNLHSYFQSPRGDEIYFMSSKGGEDVRTKFQAAEVDLVAIDEEIEEWIWEELEMRMLATAGCFIISATLVMSYDWIVDLERRGDVGDPDVFITRLHTDKNPYLPKDQVSRLKGKYDDDTLRYRFYGKSRRHTGLVYKNFGTHNIISPFSIPHEWPRWQILDPGYRLFAGLWGTITPYGQAIAYRELYIEHAELHDVVEEIKLCERDEQIDCRIIDDKEGSRLVTGQLGVLSQLAEYYHLYYTPALKAVQAGIEEVRKWVFKNPTIDENENYTYTTDRGNIALPKNVRLFCFENLHNFIKEMSQYRIRPAKDRGRSRNEPADEPVKIKDHLCDALRYWLITKPCYFERPEDIEIMRLEDEPTGASHDLMFRLEQDMKKKQAARGEEAVVCSSVLGEEW